jgi:hypothetical protein
MNQTLIYAHINFKALRAGRMMKCGIALGLHSYFSDEGALSRIEKVMSAED